MAGKKRETKPGKLVEMEQELLDQLNDVSKLAGENANTIARMCLRAGLAKIKADNYTLFGLGQIAQTQGKMPGDVEAFAKTLAHELRTLLNAVPVSEQRNGDSWESGDERRDHATDIDWVSGDVLGTSSCGKFAASEQNIIGHFKYRKGQFPADVFGLRPSGDSMNVALLPDGSEGLRETDIAVCRSKEAQPPKPGDVVVILHNGETCIKRLMEHGILKPESTNKTHQPLKVGKDAIVQAGVVGKV